MLPPGEPNYASVQPSGPTEPPVMGDLPERQPVPAPTPATAGATVVLYHPDVDLPQRLRRTAAVVGRVIVVDNGSSPQTRGQLADLARELSGLEVITNAENLGVATAFNQGLRRLAELGCHWGLLLDQDSLVQDDLLSEMAAVIARHPQPQRIAVLGARYLDQVGQTVAAGATSGKACFPVDHVIASGSLLSLPAFASLGPQRDDLFIDLVDTEYCLRARRRGMEVLLTARPLLHHALGEKSEHVLLGRRVVCTHYPPRRRYTITRNRCIVMTRYGLVEPRWALRETWSAVKELPLILLYERRRGTQMLAMALGLLDALLGRRGPCHWKL